MDVSRVLHPLFIGSCPTSVEDIDHLKADRHITAILNLQTDNEFDYCIADCDHLEARCHELEMEVRRIPVRAFDGADLRRKLSSCVAALDELLGDGHIVYIHGNLDAVRSSTVVVAYLAWRRGWNREDAAKYVARCYPCSCPNIAVILLGGGRVAA